MNNSYNNFTNKPIYPEDYMQNEQLYIENILKFNKGKKVSIYQSFPNKEDKVFSGILEQAGRDYIILSDPTTGNWFFLLMIYVNFIQFDEEINSNNQFYASNI